MGFYRRAKPVRRSPEVIAAEKAQKLALAKTCQICARPIFAETGVIAHHGYERPGDGYQTASCPGARKSPFELTDLNLRQHVLNQKNRLEKLREMRGQIEREEISIIHPWTDHSFVNGRRVETPKTIVVERSNFEALKAEHPAHFRKRSIYTFDVMKENDLRRRGNQIKSLADYIIWQEVRLKDWKQTYTRERGEWVKLEAHSPIPGLQ